MKNSKKSLAIFAVVLTAALLLLAFSSSRTDFSIEGKWKSVGNYGFGQAQPGSIVVFDGKNCNFYSPKDTYAFYSDGSDYRLDVTSFFFSEGITFKVKIIDNNNIQVISGEYVTELQRVQLR